MSKLLHIQSSPRGDRSASITVARQFIDAYKVAHPGDTVETLDLWAAKLPEFDGPTQEGKYAIMHGQKFTPEQERAWNEVVRVAEHFKSFDKFIFSVPMWNFSIPYKLKHWIDVIVQPGLTVGFSPDSGYKGLVTGKTAVAIYARGGGYGPGTGAEGYNQQSNYLKQILGFIGITDVKEIAVENTAAAKDEALAKGTAAAKELASKF